MKYKIVILLILTLFLGFLIDRLLIKYTTLPCGNNVSNPANSTCAENNNSDKSENADIAYKTFSSPKADFTFEYPSDWVYDEEEIENTTFWGFYPNMEGDYRNRPPYLAVSSQGYETVDFCSGGPATAKGDPYGFTISVFPTNDPETFITYEQSCGYIYWQKGKYFANSTDINIDDIYDKLNIMVFYGLDELDESKVEEIGKHIAQSIKIK